MGIDKLWKWGRKEHADQAVEEKIRTALGQEMKSFLTMVKESSFAQQLRETEPVFGEALTFNVVSNGKSFSMLFHAEHPEECKITSKKITDGERRELTLTTFLHNQDIVIVESTKHGINCGLGFSIQDGELAIHSAFIRDVARELENRYTIRAKKDGTFFMQVDGNLGDTYSAAIVGDRISLQKQNEEEEFFSCAVRPSPKLLLWDFLRPVEELIAQTDGHDPRRVFRLEDIDQSILHQRD